MLKMRKSKAQKAYFKGISLLVGLVALLVLMQSMPNLVAFSNSVFESVNTESAAAGMRLEDSAKIQIQKDMAGFWFYEAPSFSDRVELKDNGIIWRYSTYRYNFPFGQRDSLSRVSTAFLQPFSFNDTTQLNTHNVRVIRETWMMENMDTCYGSVNYDVLWTSPKPTAGAQTMVINGLTYYKYTGDIAYFFPAKSLGFVDDISVPGCNSFNYRLEWIRDHISRSFDKQEMDFQMLTTIHYDMVKNYYAPLCLAAVVPSVHEGETFDVDLHLYLNKMGTVDSATATSKKLPSRFVHKTLVDEAKLWRFPADKETPLEVKFKGIITKKAISY